MPGIGLPYLIDLSAIIASIFAAQPIFAGLSDFTFEPKLLAEAVKIPPPSLPKKNSFGASGNTSFFNASTKSFWF